ncbi:cold-shock protein [Bradymonas sediminis]|uniref:Uncharacterized protein n=1 Tax=Bradymonas sediminis TaxID=1548548 RepID=A0A2Z4FM65_9DELT|nr:cold shock domain-containing protein [Bradymonas sediminis]AWV89846.1 hypothetical protein DN745_11045 [Bradymonas sediminis]TDP76405.1 CspA family cold shock protein [Bradymonas sediminis]
MAYGQVTWSNPTKGFGIITQSDEEAIFVHYSQVFGGEERFLNAGDAVEFELVRGPSGLHAVNVRVCERRPEADAKQPQSLGDRG